MSDRLFLSRLKAHRFGRFSDRSVGPLSPGLTVILGRNEAGKSTLTSLIRQTLFGWVRKSKERPNYTPVGGKRRTSVFFKGDAGEWEVLRQEGVASDLAVKVIAHGGEDDPALLDRLLEGVDETLFDSVFSFDEDDLRTFVDSADVSGKLVTAESGTRIAPMDALAALDERSKSFTGGGANAEHSLKGLRAEMAATRQVISDAVGEARERHADRERVGQLDRALAESNDVLTRLRRDDSELDRSARALSSAHATLAERETKFSDDSEALRVAQAHLEALAPARLERDAIAPIMAQAEAVAGILEKRKRLDDLRGRIAAYGPLEACDFESGVTMPLVERADELARDEHSQIAAVDAARAELASAVSERERAAASAEPVAASAGRRRSSSQNTRWILIFAAVLGAAGLIAGAFGLDRGPAWLSAVGFGVAAVMLGFTLALAVRGVAREGEGAEPLPTVDLDRAVHRIADAEQRLQAAQERLERGRADRNAAYVSWGLDPIDDASLMHKRLRAACDAQKAAADVAGLESEASSIGAELDEWREGIGALLSRTRDETVTVATVDDAVAHLRIARDDAEESRTAHDAREAALAAVASARSSLELSGALLAEAQNGAIALMPGEHAADVTVTAADLERVVETIEEERRDISKRFGDAQAEREELARERNLLDGRLGASERDRALDEAKTTLASQEQVLRDRAAEYAATWLAQRAIGRAVSRWEEHRQPEILRAASDTFASLTDGAWTTIRAGDEKGSIVVIDSDHNVTRPIDLSTSTVQQLYLALRFALLDVSENVGPSVPVVMDDPLVHFDPTRRALAAREIARFSERRQVIFFTQDPETAERLEGHGVTSRRIEL